MPFFRKKPIIIEARHFATGGIAEGEDLAAWCKGLFRGTLLPPHERVIRIPTLEGEMECAVGDWIIKGVAGEFYPCKLSIFSQTYEFVDPSTPTGSGAAA